MRACWAVPPRRIADKIYRDMALRSKGQIWKQWDFEPPYFDEETPDDWVTRQTIIDPEDTKPGDWDQPKMIEDPEDTKPVYVYENEEEDEYAAEEGEEEWQPRLIDNPEYKGVWQQQRIPNPAYKGPFKPDKIENEDFVEDHAVYDDIGLVGFELWVVHNATIFDNILICDDVEYAKAQGEHVWRKHRDAEKHAKFKWEAAVSHPHCGGGGAWWRQWRLRRRWVGLLVVVVVKRTPSQLGGCTRSFATRDVHHVCSRACVFFLGFFLGGGHVQGFSLAASVGTH